MGSAATPVSPASKAILEARWNSGQLSIPPHKSRNVMPGVEAVLGRFITKPTPPEGLKAIARKVKKGARSMPSTRNPPSKMGGRSGLLQALKKQVVEKNSR